MAEYCACAVPRFEMAECEAREGKALRALESERAVSVREAHRAASLELALRRATGQAASP